MSLVAAMPRIFAAIALVVLVSASPAQDGTPKPTPEPTPAPGKYRVFTWSSGRCVLDSQATNSLTQIRREVEQATKAELHVRVATGVTSNNYVVLTEPKSYEVFVRQCRSGWNSSGTVKTAAEANALAAKASDQGSNVVIVSHYGDAQ